MDEKLKELVRKCEELYNMSSRNIVAGSGEKNCGDK
jgi:hypothetical protein